MGRWAGGVSRPVGWWVDSFFEVGGPWGDFPGHTLRGPIPSIHFSNFKSIVENISDRQMVTHQSFYLILDASR